MYRQTDRRRNGQKHENWRTFHLVVRGQRLCPLSISISAVQYLMSLGCCFICFFFVHLPLTVLEAFIFVDRHLPWLKGFYYLTRLKGAYSSCSRCLNWIQFYQKFSHSIWVVFLLFAWPFFCVLWFMCLIVSFLFLWTNLVIHTVYLNRKTVSV